MTQKKRNGINLAIVLSVLALAVAIPAFIHTRTAQAASGSGSGKQSVEEQINILDQKIARLQHMEDVNEIQNMISKMSYLYEAGMFEERLECCVAKHTPGVTVEQGARGVFEGYEGARRSFVDVEKSFERSNGAGMREAYPDIKFGSDHAGQFESELIGTPMIVVAGDGKTAKGMWLSLQAVGKTHEHEKPRAMWIWWKTSVDFVKEDGQWKIWHYLKNPYWATDYTQDWVQKAVDMPPVPPPGTQKGIPGHGTPDKPTTKAYDSYRINREPKLQPKPPEPYETFDPKEAYSY